VAGSIVVVSLPDPLESLDDELAALTDTGFGYLDDRGRFVADPSFGTAELVDGDALTARYTVAEAARWSDGTAVDAADLLLDWAAGSGLLTGGPAGHPALALASSLPQLTDDGRTLFVRFDESAAGWRTAVAPRVPAHLVAGMVLGSDFGGGSESTAEDAKAALVAAIERGRPAELQSLGEAWSQLREDSEVVSGPYRVEARSPRAVTLGANPAYRGDRQPQVETIELRPDTAGESLETAETVSGSGGVLEQLQLQLADSRGGAFDDPRIRQAFLLVVPRAALVEQVVAPVHPGAEPLASFLVPPTAAAYDRTAAANGSDAFGEVDPDAARELLAAAGSPSPEVCVLFDPLDADRLRAFELIRESAASAGFRVTDCSTPDWARMLGRGGAYDAALLAWDLSATAPVVARQLLTSDSAVANLNRLADPDVDRLLDELGSVDASAGSGAADTDDVIAELDAALWNGFAGMPLYAHPVRAIVDPRVEGVTVSAFGGGVLWNAWTWRLADGASIQPSPR
jgi:peptide/nickel transport system substrate-binding protein